jgi:hypothetical protein
LDEYDGGHGLPASVDEPTDPHTETE